MIYFRLLRYPCHDQHFVNDTVDNMYIFAKVDLGGGQSRDIIFRPQFNNSTMPSSSTGMESFGNTFDVRNSDGDESDSDREDLDATNATIGETMKAKSKNIFDVDFKVCILPGLTDVSNYKDLISSSTYVLEIHKEDLWKRIFHERNVEEYNRLWLLENPASGDAIGAAAAAPAAKGKAPPPKKAAEPVEMKAPVGPATDSDRFMIQAIWKALNASRLIRPHGAARYRLEQLLASSNDLLVEFGRLRVGVQDGDDNVVVKVIITLESKLKYIVFMFCSLTFE